MHPALRLFSALAIAAIMVAGPWTYWSSREQKFRGFHVVREGVLYRSGQMTLDGLRAQVQRYGIKTVVCLREDQGRPGRDDTVAEANWVQSQGLKFVRILPRPWSSSDGRIPAEIGLAEFRQVMDDPANYPVLVHCYAGLHRTGLICAYYRMDYEGWTPTQAIEEMRAMGYLDPESHSDSYSYLSKYPGAIKP